MLKILKALDRIDRANLSLRFRRKVGGPTTLAFFNQAEVWPSPECVFIRPGGLIIDSKLIFILLTLNITILKSLSGNYLPLLLVLSLYSVSSFLQAARISPQEME